MAKLGKIFQYAFIAALVLAWPTYGLSLAAWIMAVATAILIDHRLQMKHEDL